MKADSNIFFYVDIADRVTPSSKTVMIGEDSIFYCISSTFDDFKWTFHGVFQDTMPFNVEEYKDGYGIIINSATKNNAGIYRCHGLDEENLEFVADGNLSVTGNNCCTSYSYNAVRSTVFHVTA